MHVFSAVTRDDVRVVVLDADLGQVELERPLGREVLGVQVVGDELGVDAEEPLVERSRGLEGLERLGVLHVADVLADERVAAREQRERVLLLGAGGQDVGVGLEGQRERERRVAAAAAHRLDEAVDHAHDRVVVAREDRAVVEQERVGDACARRSSASALSVAMGSSERLPLVITSGRPPTASSSRWCSGV